MCCRSESWESQRASAWNWHCAADNDPRKRGGWSVGKPIQLTVTGPGAELQLLYEKILRAERELRHLVKGHEQLTTLATQWIAKFNITSGVRWDDQKTLKELSSAIAGMARSQAELRKSASAARRTTWWTKPAH